MSDAALATLVHGLAEAVEPLADAFESPEEFAAFIGEMGWAAEADLDLAGIQRAFGSLPGDLVKLVEAAPAVAAALKAKDKDAIVAAVRVAIPLVQSLTRTIGDLKRADAPPGLPATLISERFWERFPREILDYLVFRYLERHVPPLYAPLRLFGVLRWDDVDGNPDDQTQRRSVDWDALLGIAVDPARTLAKTYGWGNGFDAAAFDHAVLDVAKVIGLPVGAEPTGSLAVARYWDDADKDAHGALSVPLFMRVDSTPPATGMTGIALGLVPITADGARSGEAGGLALLPEASVTETLRVELAPGVTLGASGSIEAAGGLALELRPSGARVHAGGVERGKASIDITAAPAAPWIAIGAPGATRFEVGRAHVGLALAQATGSPLEVKLEGGLDEARVVVEPADLDGFLATILGGKRQQLDLGMVLAWSNLTGVTLGGRLGMRVEIPVHQTLAGVLTVETVEVSLEGDLKRRAAVFAVAATGSLQLGPLNASVKGVGVQLALGAPPEGRQGSLGGLDAQIGFRPPTGAGLQLAAGPVTGGGFLEYDEPRGEYGGGLQLSFQGMVDLSAVGLITTKMPDGSPGFSMVLIITGSGFSIPLGFGFTLTGVGGLIAVDRTVDVGVLQSGLRSGSLDAILFPKNVGKNGAQILNTLRTAFPVARNRFVFGPMAQIGWGAPKPIVTIQLGIIVELPAPVRVLILGRLQALLPDAEHAIVSLRMDMLGVIDFDAGRLSVDASLRESKILEIVLTGDIALRMSWGSEPGFLLSAGGFHPAFQRPAGFPELRRIGACLVRAGLTLRLETYLALTSNTFQIGAHLDVGYSGFGFDVHGTCGFDALVQFSPFHFQVDIDAAVSMSWHGFHLLAIRLHLGLSGPNPWHAVGSAELELGWLPSVHFGFDQTFGGTVPEALPEAPDLGAMLHDAIADPGAWTSTLAAGQRALTSAAPADIDGAIRLHPLARLEVRQRVVPLATTIDRFGAAALPAAQRFDVRGFTVDAVHLGHDDLKGEFAAAQFMTMPDEEKLRRPSFEPMTAGATLAAAGPSRDGGLSVTLSYETDVRTADAPDAAPIAATRLSDTTASAVLNAGSVARAAAAGAAAEAWAGPVNGPAVIESRYVVASTRDLAARTDVTEQPMTFADAAARLDARTADEREALQVVPEHLAVMA